MIATEIRRQSLWIHELYSMLIGDVPPTLTLRSCPSR